MVRQGRQGEKTERSKPLDKRSPEFRLLVVKAVKGGSTSSQVAKAFGLTRQCVHRWRQLYDSGGDEALKPMRPGRQPAKVRTDEPRRRAVAALKEENPEYGARKISAALERFQAIGVSPTEVRRILHEEGLLPEREAGAERERPETTLRAGRAEPAVAVGYLHVSLAPARAGVPDGVHGRPFALRGRLGVVAAAEVGAGDGGIPEGGGEVRSAAGSADRSGPAVHRLAGNDGIRGGAEAKRDPAHQEPAASSADAGEGGALLEDVVGGVSLAHGVCGLRGLPEAAGPFHRRLQLPEAAPGDRQSLARRSVFPCGRARPRGGQRAGEGECAATGKAAAGDQTILPGGEAGRRGPEHRRRP